MRHLKDERGFYRTERPRAGPVTYLLMFLLAFIFGAGAGVLMGLRMMFHNPRHEIPPPATPDNLHQAYFIIGIWGVAGGMLGVLGLFALLREK